MIIKIIYFPTPPRTFKDTDTIGFSWRRALFAFVKCGKGHCKRHNGEKEKRFLSEKKKEKKLVINPND